MRNCHAATRSQWNPHPQEEKRDKSILLRDTMYPSFWAWRELYSGCCRCGEAGTSSTSREGFQNPPDFRSFVRGLKRIITPWNYAEKQKLKLIIFNRKPTSAAPASSITCYKMAAVPVRGATRAGGIETGKVIDSCFLTGHCNAIPLFLSLPHWPLSSILRVWIFHVMDFLHGWECPLMHERIAAEYLPSTTQVEGEGGSENQTWCSEIRTQN